MNKNTFKNALLILLVGITVFSMAGYISELRESYRLKDSLDLAQGRITVLVQQIAQEKELKEKLELNNTKLKDYLRASKRKIKNLFQDNAKIQGSLEELEAKLSVLKAENKALISGRKRILAENEEFRLKLSSITELKKAIKELKASKRKSRYLKTEGNRGFLIKDGQSTAVNRVKIEVIPAQTKE